MRHAHHVVVGDPHFIVVDRHHARNRLPPQSILRADCLPVLPVIAVHCPGTRGPQHSARREGNNFDVVCNLPRQWNLHGSRRGFTRIEPQQMRPRGRPNAAVRRREYRNERPPMVGRYLRRAEIPGVNAEQRARPCQRPHRTVSCQLHLPDFVLCLPLQNGHLLPPLSPSIPNTDATPCADPQPPLMISQR